MYLFFIISMLLLMKNSVSMCKLSNHRVKSPECKNCVFFDPFYIKVNDFRFELSKCTKFSKSSYLYNNNIYYEYANVCRKESDLCGEEGKYFIKKTENEKNQ